MSKNKMIFLFCFVIGSICISTAAAMVFTQPGVSEVVLMKVVSVLNPSKYSASIWETVKFVIK